MFFVIKFFYFVLFIVFSINKLLILLVKDFQSLFNELFFLKMFLYTKFYLMEISRLILVEMPSVSRFCCFCYFYC